MTELSIVDATKNWIKDVVIGCNFCPFAAREFKKDSIMYKVIPGQDQANCLTELNTAFIELDEKPGIETVLLIIPAGFESFSDYLDLVESAEATLKKRGYEGIYQVASFHPDYLFAGSEPDDPANYTNRSPYPMLHLLREESVSKAIDSYPNPELIPEKNIAFARQKGLAHMQALKNACINSLD